MVTLAATPSVALPAQPAQSLAPWTLDADGARIRRRLFGFEPVMHDWATLWEGTGEPYIGIVVSCTAPDGGAVPQVSAVRFQHSLRSAWQVVRLRFPDLGCAVYEEAGDQSKPGLAFTPLKSSSELEEWTSKTFTVEELGSDASLLAPGKQCAPQSAQDLLSALRLRHSRRPSKEDLLGEPNICTPMARLTWLPRRTRDDPQVLENEQVIFLSCCHQVAELWQALKFLDCLSETLASTLSGETTAEKTIKEYQYDGSESQRLSLHALDVIEMADRYTRLPVDPKIIDVVMSPTIGLPLSDKYAGKTLNWPQTEAGALHRVLDRSVSQQFFALAKSQSLSLTYCIGAALLIGCFSVRRPPSVFEAESEEQPMPPLMCGVPCSMNIRSYAPPDVAWSRIACGGEAVTLVCDTAVWDAAVRSRRSDGTPPGDRLALVQSDTFWAYARILQEFYTEHLDKPEILASQSTHDMLSGYTKAGLMMSRGELPNPAMTGFGINSLGVVERHLRSSFHPQFGSPTAVNLDITNLKMGFRPGGTLTAPHSWTFRDELNLNMSYMPDLFDEAQLEGMVLEAFRAIIRVVLAEKNDRRPLNVDEYIRAVL